MTGPLGILLVALAAGQAPAEGAQGIEEAAQQLRADYLAGRTAEASRRLRGDGRLHAWNAQSVATVRATFRSRGEGLTLRVERRRGVRGDLAVAFPPGTLAKADREALLGGRLPQDLILLRAPVLTLPAGTSAAQVQVPVACASFRRHGPDPAQAYRLDALPPTSVLAKLARVLCSGELAPTPHVALAVWVAHEGLTAERLGGSSFRTFPTPRVRVGVEHGPGAERLIRRAGLQPESMPFFEGQRPGQEGTPAGEDLS